MKLRISDLIIILLFIMGLSLSILFVYINKHVCAVVTIIITYILIMMKKPTKKVKEKQEEFNRVEYLSKLLDRK